MDTQQALALVIVSLSAVYLLAHAWRRWTRPSSRGCGGCHGCAAAEAAGSPKKLPGVSEQALIRSARDASRH